MLDLTEAREFIETITGDVNSLVTFQVFYDPKPPLPQRPDLASEFTNTLENSVDFLNYRQSEHCGVYMCINGTDGKGRSDENITDLRVCFADFDGQVEPEWPVTPHLVQKRDDTHGHAFWLIEPGELTHDEWTNLQKQISIHRSTDGQVIDPARVARLPSFLHYKDPNNPARYTITVNNKQLPKYTPEQLRQAFMLNSTDDALLHHWIETRKGNQTGAGYIDSEAYATKLAQWSNTKAPIAIEGSGTNTLIAVASYGHDHGVPIDTCKQILWDNYNQRCDPPWPDSQRNHFDEVIGRAYKYATSAAGCKTALAVFEPAPEPINGWEGNKQLAEPTIIINETDDPIRSDRLTSSEAVNMLATLTAKGSHYSFAQCFDGRVYKGNRLIRSNKQFYTFNGRCWEPEGDDVIKAQIQRLCAVFKPADSFTSGVFKVLCDLTNERSVENGTWLDNRKDSTSNLAVFNNGIVDMNNTHPEVMQHTHKYFTFNEMGYNYDPSAKCPEWNKFLDSIFTKDIQLQLQQWFGYCLTNDVSLQKFALFLGAPRGGKGVVTDMLSSVVGLANVVAPSLSNLIKDSTLHSMATASLAVIPDAHSVNVNIRDNVLSTFKAITGGDAMSYHVMYKGLNTSYFKTRFVLSTNNMPDFIDSSGALVARMLVFPFDKSFVGKEDHGLRERLAKEIEGISQWAVEGLISLRNNNNKFTETIKGSEIKDEIREDMFPLHDFVSSSCVVDGGMTFSSLDDIYAGYRIWASSNGITKPLNKTTVGKHLRNSSLNICHSRIGTVRGFTGISVKENISTGNILGFKPVAM